MKKLIVALQNFALLFVTEYIHAEQKAGKKYNDKPINAVHSQMIGLSNAVNLAIPKIAKELKVSAVQLDGKEVYAEVIKPLVDGGKLFTVPAKKGYMISLQPFNRTTKATETGSDILRKLGIITD